MTTLTLPAADGVLLDNPVQWWYWTGHLSTPAGRQFGAEACFFVFTDECLLGQRLRDELARRGWLESVVRRLVDRHGFQMAHCALTDPSAGRYRHEPLFALGLPATDPGRYALALHFPAGCRATASGGGGRDRVSLQLPTWSLDLTMENDDARSPPALHYGGGCHRYPCGGYTYYYSRPRMAARGTLTVDGDTLDVSGTMWFDRQLGDLNAVVHLGWQWFAIEMNDGRSVMLFDITDLGGEAYGAVMQGASYRALTPADFSVDVLDHWTSADTGIVYPSRWQLTIDGVRSIVTPLIANQEFCEPAPFEIYWEGDCGVADESGRVTGQAYVELNGFKRPPAGGGAAQP